MTFNLPDGLIVKSEDEIYVIRIRGMEAVIGSDIPLFNKYTALLSKICDKFKKEATENELYAIILELRKGLMEFEIPVGMQTELELIRPILLLTQDVGEVNITVGTLDQYLYLGYGGEFYTPNPISSEIMAYAIINKSEKSFIRLPKFMSRNIPETTYVVQYDLG